LGEKKDFTRVVFGFRINNVNIVRMCFRSGKLIMLRADRKKVKKSNWCQIMK